MQRRLGPPTMGAMRRIACLRPWWLKQVVASVPRTSSRCMSPPSRAGWNLATSPSCPSGASWGPGGDGAWALGGGPSHGPGRATPWPEPQRGGFSVGGWTRAGGTSLWAGFAPTAEAGLTLCALHVASINAKPAPSAAAKALRWGALLLAMAFRGDATPGRYATEAMEHSGGDPGGSGEGLMSRVQEANVRAFRQKHGLLQDSDFGFAFEAFEDAVRAGGHFVAAEWARVRAEQQAHLLPAGAAVVEADSWRVTPVGPSTLRRPAVRLPTSNVGLRLRQNPDNAEAVGRRVNLLTEAFMKLGVLRPGGTTTRIAMPTGSRRFGGWLRSESPSPRRPRS